MSTCPDSKQPHRRPDIHALRSMVRDLRQVDIRPQREEHPAASAENARRLEERIARFVFGRSV